MNRERFLTLLERKVSLTPAELEDVYTAPIRRLLTESNPKILKGTKKGYLSAILHLSPADRSGFQTCAKATAGCRAACLNTAGHGGIRLKSGEENGVQRARRRKTYWYFARRTEFMAQLVVEISAHVRKAEKKGYIPAIRLNGTSDIRWESVPVEGFASIFARFPNVQFYDYTKIPNRPMDIPNYHLTFSLAESNDSDAKAEIKRGMNIAVVFDTVPERYLGRPVIDGDESDLRFLDPPKSIVGLYAKGDGKNDKSGFVRKVAA